jgi:hypothetical protein
MRYWDRENKPDIDNHLTRYKVLLPFQTPTPAQIFCQGTKIHTKAFAAIAYAAQQQIDSRNYQPIAQ